MLDADAFAAKRVRPTRDIACREYIRSAGFEVSIDDDAAVDGEARALGEVQTRPHPDTHDHKIRFDHAATFQRYAIFLDLVVPTSSR